jgi:hypothetical protein
MRDVLVLDLVVTVGVPLVVVVVGVGSSVLAPMVVPVFEEFVVEFGLGVGVEEGSGEGVGVTVLAVVANNYKEREEGRGGNTYFL